MLNDSQTPKAQISGRYTSNSAAFFMAPQYHNLPTQAHNFYHYETSPLIAHLPPQIVKQSKIPLYIDDNLDFNRFFLEEFEDLNTLSLET